VPPSRLQFYKNRVSAVTANAIEIAERDNRTVGGDTLVGAVLAGAVPIGEFTVAGEASGLGVGAVVGVWAPVESPGPGVPGVGDVLGGVVVSVGVGAFVSVVSPAFRILNSGLAFPLSPNKTTMYESPSFTLGTVISTFASERDMFVANGLSSIRPSPALV